MFKELLEEDSKEESKEKSKVEKVLDMKTGGNERVVDGFVKPEKKKDSDDDGPCTEYVDDSAPRLELNSKKNPEIKEFEMGDTVTVKMIVAGLDYNVSDDNEERCNVTLKLLPKKD
ncbi:hypothetical protein DRO38_03590 [Candidatus Bathyarchaeota archaeon]|nr:MAG: hypothetical protein DRO38_03590 [Candidatus Bathyarchaeota archaeon]